MWREMKYLSYIGIVRNISLTGQKQGKFAILIEAFLGVFWKYLENLPIQMRNLQDMWNDNWKFGFF